MVKRISVMLLVMAFLLLCACSNSAPNNKTMSTPQDTQVSEVNKEISVPLCEVSPDVTVVKTAEELFLQFSEKTDIVGNAEALKASLESSRLNLESYEIHGLKYTRYYDEQGVAFTGAEGIKVIYHNPLDCDNTCVEVVNDSAYIPDGPISLDIMYNPTGYSPAMFKLNDNNLEDETQGLYLKQTGAFSYYYFFPTPEYCYRFTIANWCENFDAIVNQLTAYCVETMP